ncbi:MAG: dipeptide/oligopeptide/nickel ABC transporter permease/ATP-binding protein [Paracoccaceae bacterium]|uniref:dipeptide/oligopeptide/nickel ABC transporter permease/ATP-binding protein n=1 Tax=Candidatus Salinivivens marinus TaxID=3381703 RepID=UPI0026B83BCE|tara:strand:+ start:99 stop:1970 length:1872 start_codon:yes stop_codon:yes gene_type:complete
MIGFLKLLSRNRLSLAGLVVIIAVIFVALVTPLLPLPDPDVIDTKNRFKTPFNTDAILGTDHLGRDLMSRLLWGTRLSLAVGFCAAFLAALIGSSIGIISGFYGKHVDNILMRGIDMLMAFPYILLALAIVAALGPGLFNALIAVAIVNIPFFARNIRGVTVGITHKEFIDAARLSGMTDTRIIITEVLPNVFPVIVIAMSTTVGWMILETAGLSFLGLGSQPPQADLGSMLGEARAALITSPYTSVVPGAMILIIVMAINLLGDGIRDALDPRLKSGVLSSPRPRTLVADYSKTKNLDASELLSVSNLKTQFHIGNRNYKAVDGVSIYAKKGACLGIIGESGSGKSVTALSIMGLVSSPPGIITEGYVNYKGIDLIQTNDQKLRSLRGGKISYIFQDPLSSLHPLYTVQQQLEEAILAHQNLSKEEVYQKCIELLKSVRIPNPKQRAKDYPHQLSGGMRQRVSIAMALANDPEVIIADEPTTALDVTVQAQILSLLRELTSQRGLAIIFITHDFGVVSQICDEVAVMYAGKIVEYGPSEMILNHPAHPYTSKLMGCVPEIGKGKRKLASIDGLPPMVDKLDQGCAFAPRCQSTISECLTNDIKLRDVNRNMKVRCIKPETHL